ncbi:uncharacterized protein LOC107322738 [Coturnix japonica]|uniref:uncharacterized protein LOC107322738 n=1 Tax=Coturnix japonica TaxID=93934 RepID=UPI000776F8E2|nr:uncharacterized protein LOC107322738 [Coturnix japonica]
MCAAGTRGGCAAVSPPVSGGSADPEQLFHVEGNPLCNQPRRLPDTWSLKAIIPHLSDRSAARTQLRRTRCSGPTAALPAARPAGRRLQEALQVLCSLVAERCVLSVPEAAVRATHRTPFRPVGAPRGSAVEQNEPVCLTRSLMLRAQMSPAGARRCWPRSVGCAVPAAPLFCVLSLRSVFPALSALSVRGEQSEPPSVTQLSALW